VLKNLKKSKRIGVDAKWYFSGPISNQIVVKNLVDNLILENPGYEIFLFLNWNFKSRGLDFEDSKVTLKYVWAGNSLISNLFIIPFWGFFYNLETILYQNFGTFWGPKRIVYVHDVIFLSHPKFFSFVERVYFSFIPMLLRFSHKIITISEIEKKRMGSFGLNRFADISVVHHGLNVSFKPKDDFNKEKLEKVRLKYSLPDQYLLFVGRLNYRKNLYNLAKAILDLDSNIPLLVVGEHDWKKDLQLERLLLSCVDAGRIRLLGKVSFEDLPLIYSLSTIFCFVSFAEGFGLPVLEAMASGVPVLTSEKTSMQEICENAAYYIDPQDSNSIGNGIAFLLGHERERHELMIAGLIRSGQFSWSSSAKKIFTIFE